MINVANFASSPMAIEVHVTCDESGSCKATCDDIEIKEGKKNVLLFWVVKDPWKIIGIWGLDDDAFMDLGANGNGWKYLDKNPKKKDYVYTGLLENETGDRAILDPTIKNGGGGNMY
jgi:hypothetical protein